MKEEIKTKAKFYLVQYAENISDRIIDIKTLLAQSESMLDSAKKETVPDADEPTSKEYRINHYSKEVEKWTDRLEKRSHALKEIDELISQI